VNSHALHKTNLTQIIQTKTIFQLVSSLRSIGMISLCVSCSPSSPFGLQKQMCVCVCVRGLTFYVLHERNICFLQKYIDFPIKHILYTRTHSNTTTSTKNYYFNLDHITTHPNINTQNHHIRTTKYNHLTRPSQTTPIP